MTHTVMDPPEAWTNGLAYRKRQAVLRMHGIPVAKRTSEKTMRRYYVYLIEHQVCKVYKVEERAAWVHKAAKTTEKRFEDVTHDVDETEAKRMYHLAIRSIYALGLNHGVVYIGAISSTRIRVLDVSLAIQPDVPIEWTDEWEQQVEAYERKRSLSAGATDVRQVVLGADPEFALRTVDGEMGIASHFLGKAGLVGCDAARLRTESGVSQQHPLVELRPEPSPDPKKLLLNMYKALRLATKRITDDSLAWMAGGMPFADYPIGGHIHFSGIPLSFALIRKLDTYLCLPLVLIEDEGSRKRRPRYGFLGDFREQPHGGFEYRTLPSWLVSPRVTKGVLALAKVVATHHDQLDQQPLTDLRVQQAFYRGDREILRPIVANLYCELFRLPMYEQYQSYLESFFQMIFHEETWHADTDIRQTWKVPPFHLSS